jgi:Ca-activated chloride channel family protein
VSFGSPYLLLFLIAVPVAVAAVVWLERRRARRATAWAPAPLLPNMVARPPSWQRTVPVALLLVGLTLLLVGFARPRASFHVSSQEATLVLVIDVSGSMAADDLHPTRLAAAKAVAERFLSKVPHGYRVAVVTFSDHANVLAPPTHDLNQVRAALARAKTGPQGTSIADAVDRGVKVGVSVKGTVKGKRPPAAIVLLSDGGQTAGQVTPEQAAAQARKAGIPVNGVLMGTPDGVVRQKLRGGYTEQIQVPAEAAPLQSITRLSGGRFAGGPATVNPKAVYDELGSRVGQKRKTIEVTDAAAAGGLVFMLMGGLLSGVWFRRVP